MLDKLNQQENYDSQKLLGTNRGVSMPGNKTPDAPTNPVFKNTMTLAEKKRLQWQQERGEFKEYLKKRQEKTNLEFPVLIFYYLFSSEITVC